ncbi:TonB-dependent receptor [Vibrio kasasachensis]|uniref:TonB-dependent receptor n=1 Tax=Vibrio kasasachensis TaxID=2910248 RepID=UPI003D127C1F
MRFTHSKLALAVSLILATGNSFAQDSESQVETMVITAQKVTQDEQDIAISTTTFSGDELKKSGTEDVEELISRTPNVFMVNAGNPSGASFISIRGVSPFMGGQTVQVLVDGVAYYTFDNQLLDVERVEVLRGPQGTLYGRNASSGVINVVTNPADFVTEGEIGITIGDYNRRGGKIISGGAIGDSDTWAYRTAVEFTDSDGYYTHAKTRQDDVDEVDNLNGRIKLRRAPSDSQWDITATLAATRIRNGNTSIASFDNLKEDPHKVYSETIGHSEVDLYSGAINAAYEGSSVDFVSLTSYTYEKKDEYNDLDFNDSSLIGISHSLALDTEQKKLAQEFRLVSKQDRNFRWLAGVYLQAESITNGVENNMSGSVFVIDADSDIHNYAAFANIAYDLTDNLEFIAGLRFDYEDIEYDYHSTFMGFDNEKYLKDKSHSEILPKLGLNYHVSDDAMLYASASRGYKSGGYYLTAPAEQYAEFDPEYTMNYEIGMKSEWLDQHLVFNTALFWVDWRDQQVEVGQYPNTYVENVADTVSRGVEAEISWYALPGMRLFANGAFTDSEFKDYQHGNLDFSGNTPSNAPRYNYSVGVNYTFLENYFVYLDYNVTGDTYFDVENKVEQDAYGVLNLRAGYSNDIFDLTLWAKNLADEEYITRAFNMPAFQSWYGRSGDPMTVGITANINW